MTENEIGKLVVDSAIAVHRELGPGLLESVYEVILAHHLRQQGMRAERQVPIPIEYQRVKFDEAFRADILVEGKVILELKSVEQINQVHKKQLQTYLRLTGLKLGFFAQLRGGLNEARDRACSQWACGRLTLCDLGAM